MIRCRSIPFCTTRVDLLQDRQARLRAVEGLDLASLVDAQHHRLVGRVHVEPHLASSAAVGALLRASTTAGRKSSSKPASGASPADGKVHIQSAEAFFDPEAWRDALVPQHQRAALAALL